MADKLFCIYHCTARLDTILFSLSCRFRVEIHRDMNFNLQGAKLIRKCGKPYPCFLAAGWNFVTRDFAVNVAVKWLAFFHFVLCRYLVRVFVCELAGR